MKRRAKRAIRGAEERGFDFSYAARAFFDPDRIIQADTRHNYGEERYQAYDRVHLSEYFTGKTATELSAP